MSSFLQPILMACLMLWGLYAEAQQVKPSRPGAPQQQQNNAQENDPMWQKVDSLSNNGLPQSALKLVDEIMKEALIANDFPQYLKANLYELKLRASFEENYLQNFIAEKDAILSKNSLVQQPVPQILHSILAQLYWQYYTQNRYVILDRTVIERQNKVIPKDELPPIETWDANIFISKVSEHYNSSLQNPDLLKSISLKEYDLIIEKGEGSKEYRPTLFDFLGHRAVDFFTNEEALLTKPLNTFIIKDISYFSEASNFIALNIESPDNQSFHFQALKVYQQLMSFHLNDRNPTALVDADLKRLEFIHANINLPERDSLYLDALFKLEQKYKGDKVSADIMFAIASHYFAPPEPPVRILKSTITQVEPNYIKAREWCLKTISAFPETKTAKNCKIMLRSIEEPFLEFTHFSEAASEQHFPMLLKFRNVKKIWLKLIKTKYIPRNEYYSDRNESLRQFIDSKSFKNWSIDLPDAGDYKHHSAELIMPELENGNYVLIISVKPEVSLKDTTLTYGFYQISDLSYISRTAPNGSGLIYVLNRKDGKPIKGVIVQSFTNNYDYRIRKYSRQNLNRYISGDDGSFSIEAPGNKQANLSFEFRYKDDTLIAENYYGLYDKTRYRERQDRITTFFFTDRAIYRPGQPVYFKGIVLNSKANEYSIIEGHKSVVSLYDVNGQKLSDIQVTSGKYGSFSGSFVLPASGLTGNMRIESESGSAYFMMEEYKRPLFEVTYKPIDTTYRINELVNITGEARTYSDVPLQDAIVNYRVVRTAIYPFFRSFFHIWPPFRIPDAEIAIGTTKVSEDGTFDIHFLAAPDPNDYGDQDPLYNFLIYADVTDINGETHSGETSVMISRKALLLETDIPKEINSNDWKFEVKATNLGGEKVGTQVKIEVHRLKDGSLITPRKWDIPDTALYSREEFKNLLPYFPFMDEEAIPAGYEGKGIGINSLKEQRIFEGSINTAKDSIVSLTNLKPEPGSYLVTLSAKDPYGTPVTLEQQLIVFNPESKKIPAPEHLWFLPLNSELKQGEKLRLLVGSSVKGHVLIELENAENIIMHKWFEISGQRIFEFEIPSDILGQVKLTATMVYDNYNHTETYDYNIKDVSRELKFNFETFRSPLLPGGTEKWKIKITSADNKPLNAEFLASMYDASLDAFAPHNWNFTLAKSWPLSYSWEFNQAFNINGSLQGNQNYYPDSYFEQEYDKLNWFGYNLHEFRNGGIRFAKAGRIVEDDIVLEMATEDEEVATDAVATQEMSANAPSISPIPDSITQKPLQVRKNLQETAFFYPHLTTNENGEVWVEFTVPEALTRWNFMGLAHSPELKYGQFNKEVVTRKELMVTPNLPRFFRDGDKMVIQAKINNLTANPIQGKAQLELLDALTMQKVNQAFGNDNNSNSFEMKENGNVTVAWNIIIPSNVEAVIVRITAEAGNHSDGEEVILPILTNRMMVTETKPLPINGNQTRNYVFNPLISGNYSPTLVPHRLTLEFTSNPAWYAIQALPWLESRENENSDQIFNRFYANSIASHIANSSPKIRNVFEIWKNRQPEALLSQLEKNQELKSLVISETPWLAEAKNESEQKQRIAVMFDLNRLANEKLSSMQRLEQKQTVNGAWPWFEGMPESRYITQLIVTGLGKLSYLKVIDFKTDNRTHDMTMRAYNWLAQRMAEDYQRILKDSSNTNNSKRPGNKPAKKDPNKEDHLSYENIQFLYSMSYLQAEGMQQPSGTFSDALTFYGSQARKYWTVKSLYAQAMIGLWAGRSGDMKTAQSIIASLRERYTVNEEMGIYWKDNISGYFWYQAPVETQAILIELFEEFGNNRDEVDKMKTWLLKQKQTQSWPSTTATADAVYALILRGTDLLQVNSAVKITLGKEFIDVQNSGDIQTEAGTGYFKTSWGKKEITSDMSNITVTKSSDGPGWGALYFQYFEDLDKIKSSAGPLKITKQLFIRENTQSGQRLIPLTENPIQIGDQIIVRVEITSDRILEYVHLKDLRASAFEPVTTISGYQWNSGLGYYQSTKDASTDFFISYLPKGIHVFEYRLVASQSGTYSNGITSIQCMYAPEFASHSEGIKVSIK